jgi:lipid-binding SYLF domain-containing protein
MLESPMRRPIALTLGLLLAAAPVFAGVPEESRARDASVVLDEIMRIPEDAIPQSMLDHAQAIAVIPNVIKAGLVLGARRGRGLIAVRSADGTWSNPSYITLTGASIGFQAGLQSTDVVLVFSTSRGVESIVHGKFTLGADVSVAAGPVGRSGEMSTDGKLKAEIYSYSRSRGLFAGVALDGAVIAIDDRSNAAIYGPDATPRAIFEGRAAPPPTAVVDFRDRLEEYNASSQHRDGGDRSDDGNPDERSTAPTPADAPKPQDDGHGQPQPAETVPLKGD